MKTTPLGSMPGRSVVVGCKTLATHLDFANVCHARNALGPDLAASARESDSVFVEWNPEWLLSLMKSPPDGQITEQSIEFGLQKSSIVSFGRDSKRYESYRYLGDNK
jgi:hypothetical protein